MTLDLSKLPPPDAILVVDHAAKVAEMKAQLIAVRPSLAPVLALASEPLVKLIEDWAYEAVLKTGEINQGVRDMLLASARGSNLDHIAANHLIVRREDEDDDTFRARTALGPEGWSVAGPKGAYRFHALSASSEVADVAVSSPDEGEVRVVILSTADDGVASAELLDTVAAALNADEIRPLTDHVTVVSASTVTYAVTALIRVRSGPDAGPVETSAEAAVRAYAAARRLLETPVARAGLIAALMQPGAEDVVLSHPAADVVPGAEGAAVLGDLTLTVEVIA